MSKSMKIKDLLPYLEENQYIIINEYDFLFNYKLIYQGEKCNVGKELGEKDIYHIDTPVIQCFENRGVIGGILRIYYKYRENE